MPRIACEWGLSGIEALRSDAAVFVIVDTLSFSTTVSVAVERGAAVIPSAAGDMAAAVREAAARDAIPALSRHAGGQFSLSPATMRRARPGQRILLPSPNGARLSLATRGAATVTGSLRNADAVARLAGHLAGPDGLVAVIPAGEAWPDGSVRPAIEDWLGAGAIIARLPGPCDSEAALAPTAYQAARSHLADLIRDSRSGRDLAAAGFGVDVDCALKMDAAGPAAMLRDGMYQQVDGPE